jgi:hypothetical protein
MKYLPPVNDGINSAESVIPLQKNADCAEVEELSGIAKELSASPGLSIMQAIERRNNPERLEVSRIALPCSQ